MVSFILILTQEELLLRAEAQAAPDILGFTCVHGDLSACAWCHQELVSVFSHSQGGTCAGWLGGEGGGVGDKGRIEGYVGAFSLPVHP